MTNLFIGIDVSMKDFKVQFMDDHGETVSKRKRFLNDQPGMDSLVELIMDIRQSKNTNRIVVGLESTSVYSWHLQMGLATDHRLSPYHCQVYSFNPKVVANFKKAYVDLPKDDWTDAWVIADRLRFGRLPESCQVDFRYLPLQRLTRFRYHLMQTITREKNYFLTNLFLKFNTLQQNEVFSNLFGATSEAVLNEFLSPDEVAARPLDELIDFLMEKGHQHFSNPKATAEALKNAARNAHRLKGNLMEPVNLILATSLETIRCLEKQVKTIDKAIAKELDHFKHTLGSVPGLGPVMCAGLIAEIGDIYRFNNDSALAKYAGLTWRGYQSGEFEADEAPLTKTGNSYLRYYFVQAANLVRQFEPEYRLFYNRKYRESKTHHHRRALVLTARKLVRMVDALLRSNQLYMPQGQRSDLA
ncbi:IS110 family transposase [Desulfitibacter alkalitolerans]|uniref:IS110 family transposase n=1 Tax=Desulfitibacter alkalitolerans TaxID=264641 RepID=UPI000AFED0CE|nr:IS110 family transposase [Desulfitibacter alkalitolerans]